MKKVMFAIAAVSTLGSLFVLTPQLNAATCNGPNGTSCSGDCCTVTATGCKAGKCGTPFML